MDGQIVGENQALRLVWQTIKISAFNARFLWNCCANGIGDVLSALTCMRIAESTYRMFSWYRDFEDTLLLFFRVGCDQMYVIIWPFIGEHFHGFIAENKFQKSDYQSLLVFFYILHTQKLRVCQCNTKSYISDDIARGKLYLVTILLEYTFPRLL